MENKIKVGVRIRPLSSKELGESASSSVFSEHGGKVVTFQDNKKNHYGFDWAFDAESSQRSIYDSMCKPLIDSVFQGYNATFFAYGQTGAGKTYTMGTTSDMQHGVVPYCINDIFSKRAELIKSGAQVSVELSYLEIYMEDCFDLLSKDGERKKLELRETQSGETFLDGLSAWPVVNLSEVRNFLTEAAKVRATGRTAMNAVSSRSHAICTLTIRIYGVDGGEGGLVSKLNLVDLAGSERAKKTQATGDAFAEGVSINKGLLALGNVVSALSAKSDKKVGGGGGHIHVPYRESRLTRLLKDSLGGNGMTALLACVSPASSNFEETVNTLRFASRASSIVNKAEVNHDHSGADAQVLLREVSKLREQLMVLQEKYDNALQGGGANLGSTGNFNSTGGSKTCEKSKKAQHSEETIQYISSTLKLTSSLKSILMQCVTEDLEMDDSLLLHIQNELAEIRATLGYELQTDLGMGRGAGGGMMGVSDSLLLELSIDNLVIDEDNMPPIMSLLDELNQLEGFLQTSLRKHGVSVAGMIENGFELGDMELLAGLEEESETEDADGQNMSAIVKDASDIDMSVLPGDMSYFDEGGAGMDGDEGELEYIKGTKDIALKQEKVFNLAVVTEQYKATINNLQGEIRILEKERDVMIAQQDGKAKGGEGANAGAAGGAISHDTLKFKQELKSKTKLLEEKIKTLRAKEVEYNKICRIKERLVKELDIMRAKVQEFKKKKVDMMKKMREDTVAHQEESKHLKHSEEQSKRKVQKAELALKKAQAELVVKEQAWRQRLNDKQRDLETLKKELEQFKGNRANKEKMRGRLANHNNSFSVNNGVSNQGTTSTAASSNLSSKQVQSMFKEELVNQKRVAEMQGKLQHYERLSKSLVEEKSAKAAQLKSRGNQASNDLKAEITRLSKEHSESMSHRNNARKTIDENSELVNCAKGITSESIFSGYSQQDLLLCVQHLWKERCMILTKNIALGLEVSELSTKIKANETKTKSSEDNDGEDVLEKTYIADDDEDEDEDYEEEEEEEEEETPVKGRGRGKGARKRSAADEASSRGTKRSRTSSLITNNDEEAADDSMHSEGTEDSQPKTKKAGGRKNSVTKVAFGEAEKAEIATSKWMAFKVPELKAELHKRGLKVGGTKDELVYRLLTFDKQLEVLLDVPAIHAMEDADDPAAESEEIMETEEDPSESEESPAPLDEQDHPTALAAPASKLEGFRTIETAVADENLPPSNSLSNLASPSATDNWKGGRQLLSPMRSLVKQASGGELMGTVPTGQLSYEQTSEVFAKRFFKPGF